MRRCHRSSCVSSRSAIRRSWQLNPSLEPTLRVDMQLLMASIPDKRPRDGRESVEGWLSMTPRGAGFVSREGGDVFIPPPSIGGAMHGDRVRVNVVARGARGPEGEVAEVLERSA